MGKGIKVRNLTKWVNKIPFPLIYKKRDGKMKYFWKTYWRDGSTGRMRSSHYLVNPKNINPECVFVERKTAIWYFIQTFKKR